MMGSSRACKTVMTSANLDLSDTLRYASASNSISGSLVLMPSCPTQTHAGQQHGSGDDDRA